LLVTMGIPSGFEHCNHRQRAEIGARDQHRIDVRDHRCARQGDDQRRRQRAKANKFVRAAFTDTEAARRRDLETLPREKGLLARL
jgi:hypothetical protein